MGDLLLLDPVPLPDGLSIPAEDWHQTPTSVRRQVLCLLKRVDALEARLNQDSSNSSRPPSTDAPSKNANDERKLPSGASLELSLAILTINRCCWSRLHRSRCFPMRVPVAIVGLQRSPGIARIRSLSYLLFAPKCPIGCCIKGSACRAARCAKRRCPRSTPVDTAHG